MNLERRAVVEESTPRHRDSDAANEPIHDLHRNVEVVKLFIEELKWKSIEQTVYENKEVSFLQPNPVKQPAWQQRRI